ncbi:hypothetical protein HPP92_004714 [Vanilla planifolia]|nr:hypothetical protein HPP92_004714 [Vanilla planifolia]
MNQVVEILQNIQELSEEELLFQSSGSAVTLYEATETLDNSIEVRSFSKKSETEREEKANGRRRRGDSRSKSEPPDEYALRSPSPGLSSTSNRVKKPSLDGFVV